MISKVTAKMPYFYDFPGRVTMGADEGPFRVVVHAAIDQVTGSVIFDALSEFFDASLDLPCLDVDEKHPPFLPAS